MTYSGMAIATLPSAQNVFTSEFGMGSGGSRSLWPPGKTGRFFYALTPVAFADRSCPIALDRSAPCIDLLRTNSLRLYGQVARAISTG